jgi:hypothetical protein
MGHLLPLRAKVFVPICGLILGIKVPFYNHCYRFYLSLDSSSYHWCSQARA